MKNINNQGVCDRHLWQLNRLHPAYHWGQAPIGLRVNLITTFNDIAGHLDFRARMLSEDADHKERLGEDLQASQYRRTAEQLRCQARRMRREAGTAVWPNAFHNVVDLSDARPVAAQ